MLSCWSFVLEGTSLYGQRSIGISPIGMPDSRIITGAWGTQRVPTLCGPNRSATGTGEAVTLSLRLRHLRCRSLDDRPSPELWALASMSRLMPRECTIADELPNKPRERSGMNPCLDIARASARPLSAEPLSGHEREVASFG